jgi:hypothetical protein
MKHRDYPLSATPYPKEDIKSKKLEVKPSSKPNLSSVKFTESKQYKESVAAREKENQRKANRKNVIDYAKMVGGGAAALVGGYYALTKEAGGKVSSRNAAGQPTYITPKKRIWRWEKE